MKLITRKALSLLLCMVLLLSLTAPVVAVGETNTLGVTFSAKLDKETLAVSDEAQTVKMTISASSAVSIYTMGMKIINGGLTLSAVESENLGLTGGHYNLSTGKVSWYNSGGFDITTTDLLVATFTVPANIPAGTYTLGASDFELTDTFGSNTWETGAYVSTTLTITDGSSDNEEPENPYAFSYELNSANIGVPGSVTATVYLTSDNAATLQAYDVILTADAPLTATVGNWLGDKNGVVTTAGNSIEIQNVGKNLQYDVAAGAKVALFTVTYALADGAEVVDGNALNISITEPDENNNSSVSIGLTPQDFKPEVDGETTKSVTVSQTKAVTFDPNGGTAAATVQQTVSYNKGTALTAFSQMGYSKTGYTFAGWDVDGDSAVDYTDGAAITTTSNVTLKAVWNPSQVNYIVKHWQQNLDNNEYTEVVADRQTLSGTTNSQTNASAKTYTGFTAQPFEQTTIDANGGTVVNIYYNRNIYTVTFMDEDGNTVLKDATGYKYGTAASAIAKPADPTKEATAEYTYTFAGWSPAIADVTANVTYKATYTATKNKYTVTFEDHDGTELKTEEVEHGKSATAPQDPTREGYTFTGWDKDFNNITGDLTVTAQYSENTYDIIFDLNYENAPADPAAMEDVLYTTVVPLPNVSRDGHTFKGWSEDKDAQTGMTQASKLTTSDSITLYAIWGIDSYTVTFVDYDSTVLKTEAVEYGKAANAPANPTRTGYTFSGWDKAFDNVTESMTVTAKYSINTYTISWDTDGDGDVDDTTGVEYGTVPTHADGTKAATAEYTYTFTGWTPAIAAVTGDATYTAQFSSAKNKYAISWDTDGDGDVDDTTNVEYGTVPTHADGTKAATAEYTYTFTGWTPAIAAVTGEATYTAQFSSAKNKYTITFVNEGGAELQKVEVEYGATPDYTGDTPTKAETAEYTYTFAGWTPAIAAVTGNATYTATYTNTPKQYTITFNTNGGSDIAPITQNFGTEINAPADPTKEGYTFDGWDKEIPATMPAENLTITAKWTVKQYTITFNTDGGTAVAPITQDFGTEINAPADPTKAGYTFAGWDKEIPATMPAESLTITAKWTVKQYTITFNTNGGTVIDSITQDFGTAITTPTAPTKAGYTFKGWDKEIPETMPAENLTITAKWDFNMVIEDYMYACDTENEGLLIVDAAALGDNMAYTVNGEKMYYTTDENFTKYFAGCTEVYVYIVPRGTTESALGTVEKDAAFNLDAIKAIGDVNGNGRTDISDANAVYQMVNSGGGYYTSEQLDVRGRLVADMDTVTDDGMDSYHGGINDADAIVNLLNS